MRLIRGTPVHQINRIAFINHANFPNRGRLGLEETV
jgi:hypothetical protein